MRRFIILLNLIGKGFSIMKSFMNWCIWGCIRCWLTWWFAGVWYFLLMIKGPGRLVSCCCLVWENLSEFTTESLTQNTSCWKRNFSIIITSCPNTKWWSGIKLRFTLKIQSRNPSIKTRKYSVTIMSKNLSLKCP